MKNGLEAYANNPTLILRLTLNELLAKINYLKATGKDLYSETGKINLIFGMSNEKMKKHPEYSISNKELIRGYLHMGEKTNVL